MVEDEKKFTRKSIILGIRIKPNKNRKKTVKSFGQKKPSKSLELYPITHFHFFSFFFVIMFRMLAFQSEHFNKISNYDQEI